MSSMSLWGETIMVVLLFISVGTMVIAGMNVMYGKNYNLGFTDSSSSNQAFIDYQDNAIGNLKGGETNFNTVGGLSLKTSWNIIIDFLDIVWNFLTGTFFINLASALNLGVAGIAMAKTFQVIWIIGLIFGALYGIFKVIL